MNELVSNYRNYRQAMNEKLLAADNKIIKRIFSVDSQTYIDGALDSKTKEMLGLVASMVLRCDDCVKYHLEQCYRLGCKRAEILEVFAVANVVGGTIVIPHTRRALEYWEALESDSQR